MNPANIVDDMIRDIKDRLTLDGKNRVFEEGRELSSEFMKDKAEPEAFTKEFLIDKILDPLELEKLPEKSFETPKGHRSVDYRIKGKNGMFLVEAKPLSANLFGKSRDGGVNQIKGLFRLAEVKENYDFGVATNGLRWVFIDRTGKVVDELGLEKDYEQIKVFLVGKEKVISPKTEEEISKKFYDWYNALLHGGRYKDHENKQKTVSEADCLVNNIIGVKDWAEKEQIAQVVMNRLIFIKFLQSKGIIGEDILKYLAEVKEDLLTPKLRQLFFGCLDRPKAERFDIDERFKDVPYLNGSLFVHTEVERKNIDYKVRAEILKNVLQFLDSFKFVHKEQLGNGDSVDPEILGYIFERAMTARDRKGTGAYYTPKSITKYISENTIYPFIIDKTNEYLKTERGYKEGDLLTDIEELFILAETTLNAVWNTVILKIRVLDNACGSGAFLLAAANILFELNRRIDDKLGLGNSDIALKKLILINSIYGVDINQNGIEIAKLRLWLWLVDSYEPERVESLPNIDYNLRVGNSLIGYVDVSEFKGAELTLANWLWDEEKATLESLLKERNNLIQEYKKAEGEEAKELHESIKRFDEQISALLNTYLYRKFREKKIELTREDFLRLSPFHWGFEFYEVFDLEKPKEDRGFDVMVGNPPYGNILSDVEKKAISNFKTRNASEIAANFIEKILEIVGTNGFVGLIVANSIAINKSTSASRDLIRKYMSTGKMALFGTRPAKIFADAEIRVLIFLGKKDKPIKAGTIYTTDAIKFVQKQKGTLLNTLSFESTDELTLGKEKIGDGIEDISLPKVGYSTVRSILLKLKENSEIVIANRINKKGFEEKMEFRKTGGYWLNALEKMPYRSTKIEEVGFEYSIERDFSILIINSSLFYLYWSTYGNLRDFPLSLLNKFPFPKLEILNENKQKIETLKEKISKCLMDTFIPNTGRVGEFRTAKCKNIIIDPTFRTF